MKITPNDGFEVAFNIACSQLEEGHPDSAKVTLQLALRLGMAQNIVLISTLPAYHMPAFD